MLKVGGIWVSPVQVEAALTEHPAVLECAVVGQGDVDGLVKPHAYVVLRDGVGAAQAADELKAFARTRIEAYKCPRWVTFVPELPRTATGKLQRFLLRSATETSHVPSPPPGGEGRVRGQPALARPLRRSFAGPRSSCIADPEPRSS